MRFFTIFKNNPESKDDTSVLTNTLRTEKGKEIGHIINGAQRARIATIALDYRNGIVHIILHGTADTLFPNLYGDIEKINAELCDGIPLANPLGQGQAINIDILNTQEQKEDQ